MKRRIPLAAFPIAAVFALAALGGCSSDDSKPPASGPSTDASADVKQDILLPDEASQTQDTGPDHPDAPEDDVQATDDAHEAADVEPSQDAAEELQEAAPASLGVVSIAELASELANKDFLLINVHVPYAGEIPGTDANLTYEDVPAIEAFVGPLGTKVVLYCYTNYMSTLAGNAMVKDGYSNVRYLDGGLAAWKNAGNAVEYHDQ